MRTNFLMLNGIDPTLEVVSDDPNTSVGGGCLLVKAGGTIKIGDVVYWSATGGVVNISTSAGLTATAGVVIGGEYLDRDKVLRPRQRTGDVGLTAATTSYPLALICKIGIVRVVADNSAILVGSILKQSAVTAGRVALGALITATQAADAIAAGGTTVTSTAANGAIITGGAITVAGDIMGTFVGRALQANGGVAGTVILAAVNVL